MLLLCDGAQASTPPAASDWLGLIYLTVIAPLLPVLAGAGLYWRTRSLLIAAGASALLFGTWGAIHFARLSPEDPMSGAMFGFASDGIEGGLAAMAGGAYGYAVLTEMRRLGGLRTACAHAAGLAYAAGGFAATVAAPDSGPLALGLFLGALALSFGLSAATGSFWGVVATLALALIAMVHGLWAAALLKGARDAGQAYLAIVCVPPALALVVATSAAGRWLGDALREPASAAQTE